MNAVTTNLDSWMTQSVTTAPSRLAYTHASPPHHRAIITLEPHGDATELTFRMMFDTPERRDATIKSFGAVDGLLQTLGRLAERLAQFANIAP
jgi:hypothetical protein